MGSHRACYRGRGMAADQVMARSRQADGCGPRSDHRRPGNSGIRPPRRKHHGGIVHARHTIRYGLGPRARAAARSLRFIEDAYRPSFERRSAWSAQLTAPFSMARPFVGSTGVRVGRDTGKQRGRVTCVSHSRRVHGSDRPIWHEHQSAFMSGAA